MNYLMTMATSPGVIELVERQVPELLPHQVLIAIKASSICGSDIHIYKGKHPSAPLPVAVGHEFAGEVAAVGSAVHKVKAGDRVTVEPVIACGLCLPCKQGTYGYCDNLSFHYRQGQGALADYFVADEQFVFLLPSHLSYEAGALIEPLAVAVHAVKRARISLGDKIVILGAGVIGILIAELSKADGSTDIIVVDLAVFRLEKALEMGATRVVNPARDNIEEVVAEVTDGRGIDKTFECVGLDKTLVQAMSLLKKGGLATIVGIFEEPKVTIPASLFVAKEITVQGSQGYCWDFDTALALTKEIDLNKLVSHVLPLKYVNEGFKVALDPGAKAIKVVLKPE